MTFHATFAAAKYAASYDLSGETCFCCGKTINGPTITYDVYKGDSGGMHSVPMHRDCAFAMAQRLIIDAWRHRAGDPWMSVKGT